MRRSLRSIPSPIDAGHPSGANSLGAESAIHEQPCPWLLHQTLEGSGGTLPSISPPGPGEGLGRQVSCRRQGREKVLIDETTAVWMLGTKGTRL